MAKLSVDQLKDLKTKFQQLKAKLLYKNIGDFSKYAAEAADFKWKAISNKILSYKKAVDARYAKPTPSQAKIEKVKRTQEKLVQALKAKDKKFIADIAKAKAAEAAKASKAKKKL
jgi:hypothetical protein